MSKKIDKEALKKAIDFSGLEEKIENVAEECFRYWLQLSLKREDFEDLGL